MTFLNPDVIGKMWLAYSPSFDAYMVNAKTGKLALHMVNEQ
jgi:hypothetical protein